MINFRLDSPRTLKETFKPLPRPSVEKTAGALNHDRDTPPLRVTERRTLRMRNAMPQPTIPEAQQGLYKHRPIRRAELFGESGPRASDVRQGQLGDCYLLASLAAVADKDPDAIRDMIRPNADGSFAVRFFVGGEPVWVRVDKKLMQQQGRPAYAKTRDSDADRRPEIWVAIVEKGYVMLNDQLPSLRNKTVDGYEGIRGGNTDNTLAHITGREAKGHTVSMLSDPQIIALLASDPMAGAETFASHTAEGIPDGHAYTLLGTRTDETGQTFVKIRNPWGHTEPGDDGKNDGVYEVSLTDFRKNFVRFSTCPRE